MRDFDTVRAMCWMRIGFCLPCLLILIACDRSATTTNSRGAAGFQVSVETAVAVTEQVDHVVTAVGTLEPNEVVTVKPEIEGRIVAVNFTEGAPVNAGDILFQLDDAKLKAAVASAEARATKAENDLARGEALFAEKTISQQEFDNIHAAHLDSQALLVLARERLADTTIRSPLTGLVSERMVSEGQVVDRDRILVTVVDHDPMKIDFAVPERYLADLAVGQTVTVTVVGLADRKLRGEVYFVDPQVDPSTRTIKLKATIPNADGALRAGMFANVSLLLGINENAVVIPEEAVVPAIDKLIVYVVTDGVARRRQVWIGSRMSGRVEITKGLAAGEVVVTGGHQKLRDESPVQARVDE